LRISTTTAPASSRLLEREQSVERLSELARSAADGQGSIAAILGRPGEGKTTLLEAARALAEEHGLCVCRARGGEMERDFAFGVVRQLLEPEVMALEPERRRALFTGSAGLARSVFGLASGRPPEDPFAVLHGLYWVIAGLAARGPVLLAVDDLHWADETSLELLAYLRGRIEDLPVLVVMATRPPESDQGPVATLTREEGIVTLPIGPLGLESAERLIEHAFDTPPDPLFTVACRRVTAGNPFAISELLGELRREGASPDAATAATLHALTPAGLERNVLARLGRLPAETLTVAHALAILDDGAPLRQVAMLSELDLDRASRALDALAGAGILEEDRELRFVHPLLHTAVHESMSTRRRARLHAAAAALLGHENADPEAIAAHLLHCDPAGEQVNVEHLLAAARAAMLRGAPGVAATHLRRALAEPPPIEQRGELLAELGRAESMAGDARAIEHLQAAHEHTSDPSERAELDYILADACCYAGERERMFEVLTSALRDLGQRDPQLALRLRSMNTLARAILDCGWPAEQDAEHEQLATEAGPATQTGRSLALTLAFVGALSGRHSPQEMAATIETTLDDALLTSAELSHVMPVGLGLFGLVFADRLERAVELADRMMSRAAEHGATRALGCAHHVLALAELRRGALAEAEASARISFEIVSAGQMGLVSPLVLASLGEALLERGRLEEAAEVLTGIPLASSSLSIRCFMRIALARLHSARDDREAAIDELLALAEEAACNDLRNPSFLPWRSELTILIAEREPSRARELAASELRDAHRLGLLRCVGMALRARAVTEHGEAREATLHESVAALERSPARLELTRALIDLGGDLRRRGQRAAAREPLRRALELAHRCGAEPLVKIAGEELRAADGRPRRRWSTGVEALTPSELRVARHAAEGRSNREIAQALFVTTKTIEMHLSNAYRKLDIGSREALPGALDGS
jgi:DNA-binding CsgD family transcriptional regulator